MDANFLAKEKLESFCCIRTNYTYMHTYIFFVGREWLHLGKEEKIREIT